MFRQEFRSSKLFTADLRNLLTLSKKNLNLMTHQHNNLSLADAPLGHTVRIRHLRTEPGIGLRLRELGISENVLVRCLHRGYGNIICQVVNTRIAVNLGLARRILVTRSEPDDSLPHRSDPSPVSRRRDAETPVSGGA